MLDLYTEGKISEVSRSICTGIKREEWSGVSGTEADSVRAGFPGHASSRRSQQQRQPKPKQRSHLRSSPAFGFLCLLSFFDKYAKHFPTEVISFQVFSHQTLEWKNSWPWPQRDIRERAAVAESREALSSLSGMLEQVCVRGGAVASGRHIHCWASYHSTVLTPTDARASLELIFQSLWTSLFRI